MRLIDADALLEHIKGLPTWWADGGGVYGQAMKYPEGMFDVEDVVSSIENAPTLTQPNEGAKDKNVPTNEPLTLEELREMDEPTPVWWEKAGYWCLCERGFIITPNGNIYEFEENNWTFYRRPPEEMLKDGKK